jgi:hypothetical protein
MIHFKNIEESKNLLPYNKEQYFDFLDDENELSNNWSAVSFQVLGRKEREMDMKDINIFEPLFINIIKQLDDETPWILNHFYTDYPWFMNKKNNLTSLRAIFKENNKQDEFRGSLIFMKTNLFECAKDLISYPHLVVEPHKRDLDISHSKLPFIIKITGHLTIDLFSTDNILLSKIIDKNQSNPFTIKEYQGSSLTRQ